MEVDRTQGVSTTDLINRILKYGSVSGDCEDETKIISPYTGTQFLATTRKLRQFSTKEDPPVKKFIDIYFICKIIHC